MKKQLMHKFTGSEGSKTSTENQRLQKQNPNQVTNETNVQNIKTQLAHKTSDSEGSEAPTDNTSSPEEEKEQPIKEKNLCVVQPFLHNSAPTKTPETNVADPPPSDASLIKHGFSRSDQHTPNMLPADVLQIIKIVCPNMKNHRHTESCPNYHPDNYKINIELSESKSIPNESEKVKRRCKINISVPNDECETGTPSDINSNLPPSSDSLSLMREDDSSDKNDQQKYHEQNIVHPQLPPIHPKEPDKNTYKQEMTKNKDEAKASLCNVNADSEITTKDLVKNSEHKLNQKYMENDIIDENEKSNSKEVKNMNELHRSVIKNNVKDKFESHNFNDNSKITAKKENNKYEDLKKEVSDEPIPCVSCEGNCEDEVQPKHEDNNFKFNNSSECETKNDMTGYNLARDINENYIPIPHKINLPITICKDYLRGVCGRGEHCINDHHIDEGQVNLVACRHFMYSRCFRSSCYKVHITYEEKDFMCRTGQLPPHIQIKVHKARAHLEQIQRLLKSVQTRIGSVLEQPPQSSDHPIISTYRPSQYSNSPASTMLRTETSAEQMDTEENHDSKPFKFKKDYDENTKYDRKYKEQNTYTKNEAFEIIGPDISNEKLELLIEQITKEYKMQLMDVKTDALGSSSKSYISDEKLEATIREMVIEHQELQKDIKKVVINKPELYTSNQKIEKVKKYISHYEAQQTDTKYKLFDTLKCNKSETCIKDIKDEVPISSELQKLHDDLESGRINILKQFKDLQRDLKNREVFQMTSFGKLRTASNIINEHDKLLEEYESFEADEKPQILITNNDISSESQHKDFIRFSQPHISYEQSKANPNEYKIQQNDIINEADTNERRMMCLDYLRGKCKNEDRCKNDHKINKSRLSSVICSDFRQYKKCKHRNCRYVYMTLYEDDFISKIGQMLNNKQRTRNNNDKNMKHKEYQPTQPLRNEPAQWYCLQPNNIATNNSNETMIKTQTFLNTSSSPPPSAMLTSPPNLSHPDTQQQTFSNISPLPFHSTYIAASQHTSAKYQTSAVSQNSPVIAHSSQSLPNFHASVTKSVSIYPTTSRRSSPIMENTAQYRSYNAQNYNPNTALHASHTAQHTSATMSRDTSRNVPYTPTSRQTYQTPKTLPLHTPLMAHSPPPPPPQLPHLSLLPPFVTPLEKYFSDIESDSDGETLPTKRARLVDALLARIRKSYEESIKTEKQNIRRMSTETDDSD